MDPTLMADMRDRLLARVRSEATLLAEQEQPDPVRRAALVAWCHRVGGTSGTIGLANLSAAAFALEAGLRTEGPCSWLELRERLLVALCQA